MIAVWNIIRHRYLGVSATVAMLLLLPLIVISTQRTQTITGIAEGATTVVFSPASLDDMPLEKSVGEEFPLNVLVDPGENIISVIELDINYDPSILKLSPDNPVTVNETVFTDIQGPFYSEGRVQVVLSVGVDLSKSISSRTRTVTLNFVPIAKTSETYTTITFGENTKASSVEVNDLEEENIISTTAPSYIKIN